MMLRYKLTDQNLRTHGDCQWVVGKWKKTNGKGDLCGPGWLHCCDDPLLAVLLNPIHGRYEDPRLWECEVAGKEKRDGQVQAGWTRMRLVREIPLPAVTTEQRVRFGILCAKAVCADAQWNAWADGWLAGRCAAGAATDAADTAELPRNAVHVAARAAALAAALEAGVIATHAVVLAAAAGALDLLALAREAIKSKSRRNRHADAPRSGSVARKRRAR